MARKAAKNKTAQRRKRRTPEEVIRDLQRQIAEVRERATTRELKQSAAIKHTISIMRTLNKALDEAAQEKNGALRHALADARKPLASFLESVGITPPKARLPRGRRPKATS